MNATTQPSAIVESAARNRQFLASTLGHQEVFDELWEVWDECRVSDWDGYDALPVEHETLNYAYRFLEGLPLGFRTPEIGAEPDGALTIAWRRSTRRVLSVSVHPDGELHYAALFGPNRVCGTEVFFNGIPKPILDLIRKVYAA